jgi:mono/diheme cytochrome c family protein
VGAYILGVTEVPEYLLERSRQRRAALGLPGGEAPAGGGGPSTAPAPTASAPAATASADVGPQPAAAATATAVVAEPVPAVAVPTGPRSGIPIWMMPVILILPFWAVVYMGSFAAPKGPAGPRTGAQIFASAGCGSCHGATGGGGVGPKLAGGEAKLTFPNEADHVNWVSEGSAPSKGKSYGDPNRPGGPRPPASGGMPAFKGQLTPEEILAVVQYERDRL